jgi:hypothetical protein
MMPPPTMTTRAWDGTIGHGLTPVQMFRLDKLSKQMYIVNHE